MASKTDGDSEDIDIDNVLDNDGGEDKEIAAMGVAQTIGTVCYFELKFSPAERHFRSCLLSILHLKYLHRFKRSSFLLSSSH